jgi:hypothetical protein
MHCPFCGHTGDHHGGDSSCLECTCELSWVDIMTIHIRLRSGL